MLLLLPEVDLPLTKSCYHVQVQGGVLTYLLTPPLELARNLYDDIDD